MTNEKQPDNWGAEAEAAINGDAFAGDGDNFSFSGSGVSGKEVEQGGQGLVDKEGWYHFAVHATKDILETLTAQGQPKSPAIRFDMLVLQDVEGQSPAGSKLFHKVYVAGAGGADPSEGSRENMFRFLLGMGLLRSVEDEGGQSLVDAETGKADFDLSLFHRAKGRQCIAQIKHKPASGKFREGWEIPFNRVFQVDDPRVAEVPKNEEALAMLAKEGSSEAGDSTEAPPFTEDKNPLADLG